MLYLVVWTEPLLQTIINGAVLALDGVRERGVLPTTVDGAFSVLSGFLIV